VGHGVRHDAFEIGEDAFHRLGILGGRDGQGGDYIARRRARTDRPVPQCAKIVSRPVGDALRPSREFRQIHCDTLHAALPGDFRQL
jgi:hypothetical protein